MGKTFSRRSHTQRNAPLSRGRGADSARGYALIELVVVVVILVITTAIALPLVQNASTAYQVRSAVNAVTGVIQTTRYQAISGGFPYRVAFDKTSSTYQIWKSTCGYASPCWTKVGGAVPLSGSSVAATINQNTSLDFYASGQVVASTGALSFTLTYKGTVETFTVSTYGNTSVSP
jgi:prepilin-type N-terminal cleavage/methylation domain-containing protein